VEPAGLTGQGGTAHAGVVRAIVIGAGRGQRLMPTTADAPKCFTEIGGRRILDWVLSALRGGGIEDITFVGGYRIDAVKAEYPDLDFVENPRWAETNILASLMCARDRMDEGFVSTYADIVYRAEPVKRLVESPHPITLMVDTAWRKRYAHRSQHPETDGEKVLCAGGVVQRVHRDIDPGAAYGEFTGVAKLDAEGTRSLVRAWETARDTFGGGPFREAAHFDRAYFIHLLQQMIEDGTTMHHVDTHGGYWEIDTQEDYDHVRRAHAEGERWG
jgi:choline kinase